MSLEDALREKLRKIEALYAGAATAGERAAAGAAAERIRARLLAEQRREPLIEVKFSLPDPWSLRLFLALCRRYGLRPYRYHRMRRQAVMVRAPRSFLDGVLWPEFLDINAALTAYISDITDKVIREEVFGETADAEERARPR
jgi:hypothetical protein